MADPEANVIYGIVTNEHLRNAVRVTVVATGFEHGAGTDGEAKRRAPLAASGGGNGKAAEVATHGGGPARGRRLRAPSLGRRAEQS